jgi:triosephosphate isomerase
MPGILIAGNWKMHKTAQATVDFLDAFLPLAERLPAEAGVAIIPPFTSLPAASTRLRESRVALGAQTMHWADHGAYTGEISPPMLREFGVTYVILGHSERRAYNGEDDRSINRKVRAAFAHGIIPIVAVGETLEERHAGVTESKVTGQTKAAFEGIPDDEIARAVVAYEPIWAIGTGENCDADEADRVMGEIRSCVGALANATLLYGGSMKPENARAYMARPNINGGLVGGASLEADVFAALIGNALA